MCMTVIDCIMVSYELDALAVRERELADVVDLRVVVQGDRTFRGDPLKPVDPEVFTTPTVLKIVEMPESSDPWVLEKFLRQSSLDLGLREDPRALVILSDADEIPHPDAIRSAAKHRRASTLWVDYREWWMDWRAPDNWQPSNQPVIGYRHDYQVLGGAQAARERRPWPFAPGRGWHLSTLGNAALAHQKVSSFAHSEYDNDEYNSVDLFDNHRNTKTDMFDRFVLKSTTDLPGCYQEFTHLLSPEMRERLTNKS